MRLGISPNSVITNHPQISNHPWIDRAYVAQHPRESSLCLVLAQDKVNASDFPGACRKLNKAADELMQVSKDFESALLVINVIGADEDTRSQSELNWPHILIRGRREVEKFYTAHFADLVWFARQRHLLSLQSGGCDWAYPATRLLLSSADK